MPSKKKPEGRASINRRKLLKGVVGGVVVSFGSGVTTAKQNEAETVIEREYANRETIEQLVSETELVDALVDKGILTRDDLPALKPTGLERIARRRNSDGVAVQSILEDGAVYPRISIVVQAKEYAVQLFLYPESKDYAFVEAQDGSESFIVRDSAGDVQPEGCYEMDGVVCESGITCGDVQIRAYERLYCTQYQQCVKGADLGCKLSTQVNCKDCS